MATYATTAELADWLQDSGTAAPGAPADERLLERAERDIDVLLGNRSSWTPA
jgi:hypothetical protein